MTPSRAHEPVGSSTGVLALGGYGIRIAMERGHLVVEDGVADQRSTIRLPRSQREIRRIFVHGHSGTVSLDALRWMRDVGISFVQVDVDGTIIATSAPGGVPDSRLLRGQILAVENGLGFDISREILTRKVERQLSVMEAMDAPQRKRELVALRLGDIESADTPFNLAQAERLAGKEYWKSWQGLPVKFTKQAQRRFPEHWARFGTRRTPIGVNNQNAIHPINALLNYTYSILEAETRLACQTIGLNPHLGFFHADIRYRPSLAFDSMEPLRPEVDAFLLSLLERTVFGPEHFFETRAGICRVMPTLAAELSGTSTRWGKLVGTIVEDVGARLLACGCAGSNSRLAPNWRKRGRKPAKLATTITGRNRRKK